MPANNNNNYDSAWVNLRIYTSLKNLEEIFQRDHHIGISTLRIPSVLVSIRINENKHHEQTAVVPRSQSLDTLGLDCSVQIAKIIDVSCKFSFKHKVKICPSAPRTLL